MTEDLKTYFQKLIKLVDGIRAVIVSDHDGVPVLQVRSEVSESQREYMLKPNLLAASGATIEQGSKIGLGKTKNVTAVFSNYQLICFNKLPKLVVTIIADKTACTGHILSLEQEFHSVVEGMQQVVELTVS